MADLSLKLSRTGGAGGSGTDEFMLQATNINFSHERAPIMVPLPASNPLFIDLGQWKVSIQIEGTANIPGTNLTDGGIAIADKDDLETIATTTAWWNGIIRLKALDDEYEVAVASAKFALMAPVIDRWTFNMSLTGKVMEY